MPRKQNSHRKKLRSVFINGLPRFMKEQIITQAPGTINEMAILAEKIYLNKKHSILLQELFVVTIGAKEGLTLKNLIQTMTILNQIRQNQLR